MGGTVPRIFSSQDRAAIRGKLIEVGRDYFQRFGIKKTAVEELAKAAGIAKGTFYHFFESKEDLCMEIFEEEEQAMRAQVSQILSSRAGPKETVRGLLAYALDFTRNDSLLATLRKSGEYMLLARGVGREKLERHLDNDEPLARLLIENLEQKGAQIDVRPRVIAGMLRAVVMLTFHEDEIGTDVYDQVMERILEFLALGIISGKEQS